MNSEGNFSNREGSLQFNFVIINPACLPGFATHLAPLLEPAPFWPLAKSSVLTIWPSPCC